jgi:RsiW-degrading membrane proteinase PrsW (M82 family)
MLSTAPILFYDHVVRKGYELHFFLFRIKPENFMRSSETFVTQYLTGQRGVIATSLGITIVSFILVAVIEEWSKHWVTRKSDRNFFRSVDDVIQLSIIAAIGFAFAENIINPTYFIAFVRDYLVIPDSPQWGAFLGSVIGRSVITNMVHITASGVLGYFYGVAFFAEPYMDYMSKRGTQFRLASWIHSVLQVRPATVYRDQKMLEGLLLAIGIHGLFNILTSLSDVLPGNPASLGELFGYSGIFSNLHIITVPSIIYVFGGWFLLMYLFRKKEHIEEFGRRENREVFILEPAPA